MDLSPTFLSRLQFAFVISFHIIFPAFTIGLAATMQPTNLALFWAAVIAAAILIYTILDGFDLGVGILFGTPRDTKLREEMIASISPFWDGNETWLIVIGASLFAAFPTVYAVFLPAFYIPVLLLLLALVFRGVAFEFRGRGRTSGIWDARFLAWLGNCDLRSGCCRRRHDPRHS
jgi:cytochrome d oxidase subunit CydB